MRTCWQINMEKLITIHLKDLVPFLDVKFAQRIVLRYLHDKGIEGEISSDENGVFIRYIAPSSEVFESFSTQFYDFLVNYHKHNE